MTYILIFGLTAVSCLIFDNLGLIRLVSNLMASYKSQIQVMKNQELSDEEKQKALMKQVGRQILYLLKLIGSIFLFIAPFLLIFVLEKFYPAVNSNVLYTLNGILVSVLAVVLYITIKKLYVKLLARRKESS